MVFAKEFENFFGFGGLCEGGVAAQIAEYDNDLAAMAFEDLLVTLRDDEFGQLWRDEPFQPPDPPQLLDLFGDPRLKNTVQFGYLIGALLQFVQQPRVLHRDDRLVGEGGDQCNLLFGKRLDVRAGEKEAANDPSSRNRGTAKPVRTWASWPSSPPTCSGSLDQSSIWTARRSRAIRPVVVPRPGASGLRAL